MTVSSELIFFSGFTVFVIGMLLLDLLVIGRKSHTVSLREASVWSIIWIALSLLFFVFLWYFGEKVHGFTDFAGLEGYARRYAPYLALDKNDFQLSLSVFRRNIAISYLSGYLIEKMLSVDNLFVMMMILASFSVDKSNYKPVLFWGIMGALVLRFVFIFSGAALIERFEWIMYVFGGYLLYSGVKMFLHRNREETIDPQHHPLVKFLSTRFAVLPGYAGGKFFTRQNGKVFITPLFVVLVLIEFSDLVFALDSIPAIFAVTRDPYIVFFSNIFAILGLRSLFFLLIEVIARFHLLKAGVSLLLVFIAAKMLLHEWLVHIGYRPVWSLYVITAILLGSVLLSLVFPRKPVV